MRVPITIFDRHIHLSRHDAEKLFGGAYTFSVKKKCVRSDELECNETLDLRGKNGDIKNISIILPFRKNTQVELFESDRNLLGQEIPDRFSHDLEGSGECTLIGSKGSVYLNKGVIIARPHIHLSVAQAQDFGFKNNEIVSVTTYGSKIYTFQDVKIRAKDYFEFDFHINREQADLAGLRPGDWGEITSDQEHQFTK